MALINIKDADNVTRQIDSSTEAKQTLQLTELQAIVTALGAIAVELAQKLEAGQSIQVSNFPSNITGFALEATMQSILTELNQKLEAGQSVNVNTIAGFALEATLQLILTELGQKLESGQSVNVNTIAGFALESTLQSILSELNQKLEAGQTVNVNTIAGFALEATLQLILTELGQKLESGQSVNVNTIAGFALESTLQSILSELNQKLEAGQTVNVNTIAGFALEATMQSILTELNQKLEAGQSIQVSNFPANITGFSTETTLASILAKIIASPATEAKQDTSNTKLDSLIAKDYATQTTLAQLLTELQAKADLAETQPTQAVNPNTVITATGTLIALNQAVTLDLDGQSNTTFQLSGTWVGTVQFEASNNGTDWTTIFAYKSGDLTTPSSNVINSTNNDIYRCTTAGFGFVRAIVTAYTSGTVNITAKSTNTTSGVFLNFPLPTGANSIGSVNLGNLYLTGQATQTAVINNILSSPSSAVAIDIQGYRSFSIQVVSTGTGGTFIFEGSNDNVNFQAIPVFNQALANPTQIVTAITATASSIIYVGSCNFRYIRLRIATTITGGSIQAFATFTQNSFTNTQLLVSQGTAGNLNANVSGSVTATVASTTANIGTNGMSAFADSVANLAISATFTGTSRDGGATQAFARFVARAMADQAGTFRIEQSADNTNWRRATADVALTANTVSELSVFATARYHRVIFVNGGVAQTIFIINSAYLRI